MDKENFFTKLRRVAASTESETVRLKACMERPVAVRSSSNERDGTSAARLALKEMQYDVAKLKENSQEQLKGLRTSFKSFGETLAACRSLFNVHRQQAADLESYLEQYGYKKYKERGKQEPQHKNQRKAPKEVTAADESDSTAAIDASETPDEKVPSTPQKDPSSSHAPVDLDKTPQLADFGVSQWTMDRLANVGGSGQDMKTEHFSGYQYGSSVPSAIPSHVYLSTPQNSRRPHHHTPFTNQTIMVTPGMFGNRLIPTETPSQFIDTKSYLPDSPVPPVLMSHAKKREPRTSDPRVTHRRDMEATSPEPEPPTVTSWAEHMPLPAPPAQLHVPVPPADVTPPMPPCLAPQANQLPCEPVQLAEKFASRSDHSPVEPVQLLKKFGSDFKMARSQQSLNGASEEHAPPITTVTSSLPSGHPQPFTPKAHQRLTTLAGDGDMPQTPELTLTYQRFEHAIPPVMAPEFGQVADYLQRLIPMDVINQKLQDINAMLANKQDASFISESEMLALRLGSKTKAFTLLLAKLNRLCMGKNPDSGEPVFIIVK